MIRGHSTLTDLVPPSRPGERWLAPRWWLIAVAFHIVLLGMLDPWGEHAIQPRFERPIDLRIVTEARPRPWRAPGVPTPPLEPLPAPPTETGPAEATPAATTGSAEDLATPDLDITRLLEAVGRLERRRDEATSVLGRVHDTTELDRLYAPLLPAVHTRFADDFIPTEVEIVDRWMSPGGENNVVLRAPDGNTYCGRQSTPDDLRPWLQMPMMFHPCGGGGRRSSGVGWRNN